MRFIETPLKGAYIIEIEPIEDERGFFARTWCRKEFEAHNLKFQPVQCNLSYNRKKGTIRGMHYQIEPYEETKIVTCIKGAIYDVIIDLRSDSKTYRHWFSLEISASNRKMLYIPQGFAHGFQTLEDDTEVYYQMSEFYYSEAARGIRWDDLTIGIEWPLPCNVISEKDLSYERFEA